MQTFLPYPGFAQSAAALDSVRLGKQRVEVLQILRATTFPSYGWGNHPATLMWRGYVPALANYGVAMVDEWISRGAADSTRAQIAEFAPVAANLPQDEVLVPSWLGDSALHRSHQSNLIRKLPEFYGPQFPLVPNDLPYVWPGPDLLERTDAVVGTPLWILRARDAAQRDQWHASGEVAIGEVSPSGRSGPKWRAQREAFRSVPVGTRFAVLVGGDAYLQRGEFVSEYRSSNLANDSEPLVREVSFDGSMPRSSFPYPALLQDPRMLFETTGPRGA